MCCKIKYYCIHKIFHSVCFNRPPSLLISCHYVLSDGNRSGQKKTAFQQLTLVCVQSKQNKSDFGSNLKDKTKTDGFEASQHKNWQYIIVILIN